MKLGIIYDDEPKIFLAGLLEDWQEHYEVEVYDFNPIEFPVAKGRINPLLHRLSLQSFLNRKDIVYFEWAGENLVLASHLPHKAKIIARLHSWELFHHAKRVNWQAVDKIVVTSQAKRRQFNERYPGNEERIKVLPDGKALDHFSPVPHSFSGKIAVLASIIPRKRIYEMVLTLSELHKRGSFFSLHLGGKVLDSYNNQQYYASVLDLIQKVGLSEYVFFDDWVDPAQWLPEMDIFISNSYWEGQQNALLEALAVGCYCLSHVWSGAEEILPQENLFTSEAMLVEKILAYAAMPEEEKESWQQRMRGIAEEKFDLKDSRKSYRALIESVYAK